ncbi:MAG: hypothetical protein JJU33_10530 [Phycisphaerales bacterium]|nr:hypothetical protein [Phycisphaerales bacterium]
MRCNITAAVVALSAGIACSLTNAQTIEWAAPVSGNWNEAANWSPNRLPDPTDSVLIGVAGQYEVIHNAPSGSVLELAMTNPAATLGINGGRTLTINGDLVNDGLLVVNFNSFGTTTGINFGVDASILGDGLLRLNRGSSSAQLTAATGVVVTHGPDHTIAGMGQITAGMINNGLIDADVENETLRISGENKTNNALMAAGAGTLELTNVIVDQGPSGAIIADGGEVLISSGVAVSGGSIGAEQGSRVLRAAGTSTLAGVSLHGTVDVNGGATTAVLGGLINNGVVTINANSFGTTTSLRFDESGVLGGDGLLRLNRSSTTSQLIAEQGAVVTHGPDHTIAGFGQITAGLINNGVIDADVEGQTLRLTGENKTNNALMAAGAGTLELTNVIVDQGPSGAILADGGEVLIGSGVTVSGGSIGAEQGSRVLRASGTSTLAGVSLHGTVDVNGGSTIAVLGGLTNNGVVTINANSFGTTTSLRFDESGVLGGDGLLRLNRSSTTSQLIAEQGAVVTHGPDHSIAGFGQITAGLINNGLIDADVEGETLRLTGESKTNNASMIASEGDLELFNVSVQQGPGGSIVADGGEVLLRGTSSVVSGLVAAEAGSRVTVSGGSTTLTDVEFSGNLEILGGSSVLVGGAGLTNNGVITVNANDFGTTTTLRFEESGSLDGVGVVLLNRPSSNAQLTTAQDVSAEIGEGQTVSGIGRISGDFLLRGVTAPGLADPGALDYVGNITLAPTHTLELRLAGPSSSTNNYDRVTGSATVQLGGTLSIETINNYTPDFGQSYTILAGGSSGVSGQFAELVASEPLPQGLAYRLVYAPNQVRLNVTCIADINGDFVIDADDFFAFLSLFAAGDPQADINDDGVIDADDFFAFLALFAAGC